MGFPVHDYANTWHKYYEQLAAHLHGEGPLDVTAESARRTTAVDRRGEIVAVRQNLNLSLSKINGEMSMVVRNEDRSYGSVRCGTARAAGAERA
jgi:hypothetical protein